ncbi:MAG: glycerol-3-phosphate 1-O-acyltransferase PlsY [Candidatus Pacebacteria bacterium]|jgi:glycerol-3-phosphate acyltransferase PlsY|nr:glycerol-3-phosphate 1-O-acyltransferase PlsY [Candidatus Paceibacterota bacterium]MDD5013198.1 glycerol-3-phosphate 1-O-acyltransferase PlsY [Candidatus Paceibacterota bacterium]MDD5752660.1 glycerol-3-phosphate 1-O-acyltransferase PlsY [Candidatus Paceibacterota bacterium]
MENQIILLIIFTILGYLSGSIPFGYLIGKIKNIDVRKQGSGNIGGTNVARNLGFKYGILVGLLDISKAILPIYIASQYLIIDWQMAIVSISPVIGHVFPVWLKFKGGKGVSTVAATLFMILGLKYSLIFLGSWICMLLIINIMSLTNLIIVLSLPILFWYKTHSVSYLILSFLYIIIIWWAHRENIQRLKQGKESKLFK